MVIVEGSPELTFGIRHHIRTRPAGWTDGADAGAAGTTVPISGARSMNETMSPRSGTAMARRNGIEKKKASAARNRRSVDRAGDRLRSVGRLNDQLLPEDDHRRGRPTGGPRDGRPIATHGAGAPRIGQCARPTRRTRPVGRAVHASVSLGVLSNRQDEPPRQRAVLTDRSVVTALPSTTPRPVLKSSADDSETPHPGPRDRAAAIPARRGPEGPCFDAFPTCTGSPPPYGRSFPETGPKARPAVFSRVDTALEAFRRNPTDGSLAPTPARRVPNQMSEPAVPLVLGRITIVTTAAVKAVSIASRSLKRVNNPTLGEFCFAMIGRADIEGSKSDVAMNAWPPQATDERIERPMLSQSLRVLSVRDQASICPFALRESNSPPGGVLGIRIAPGPGPAETPRTRTAAFDGRPHAHGRGPRFDARSPRLVLNATGISTAARHERAQADGTATAPRAGRTPDEPTASRRRDGTTADGRTHPRPEPRVPLYRVSGETMRVVVFQGRRGDGRPKPPAWTPDSHLCYTSACLRTMPD
ncbi:hypothetical protein KEM48_014631 [Puccinia striiformis f. sp. tritici PST-130]|nr:hypothetical protein KEM48_014631 [Puccinia striiformis f. sp. tritici PST-130]